ncbi:MAG: Bax inhibitor-1/YccA family protein [Parvularculaceae bacterium]|nr:Bax inhibitor-1/YccA family protein [Parvularculaceae bacterium]
MNDTRRTIGATSARTGGLAIDQGLRQYMLGVYNYMALAVAGTGLVSLAIAANPEFVQTLARGGIMRWLPFIGILGIGFIAPRVIFSGSKTAAHGLFWLYAALWGVAIAPMLYFFNQAGLAQEIYKAFFITAATFGATSLYGYTAKRDLSGMGTFLFMASIGLLIAIGLNAFVFKSTLMSLVTSGAVVLVFSAVTAYETQMIKEMYREGSDTNDRASIFGAFALYGSFVTLFVHILNILGIMRSE